MLRELKLLNSQYVGEQHQHVTSERKQQEKKTEKKMCDYQLTAAEALFEAAVIRGTLPHSCASVNIH